MSADDLQQRLLAVVAASGSLLRSPRVDDVIPAVLRIARDLVKADGYAIWRLGAHDIWRIRSFDGVSPAFANLAVGNTNPSGAPAVPFTDPFVVEDVFSSELLRDRAAAYVDEGLRLVVDDEEDARALVQAIVEEAGGIATTAASAALARQRLDAEVPNVMVADQGMPGMDGLALIEAVRRRPDAARAVPAIALTAYARSQDRLTALSSGYQRHLPKPIDHAQLVAVIRAITAPSLIPGNGPL